MITLELHCIYSWNFFKIQIARGKPFNKTYFCVLFLNQVIAVLNTVLVTRIVSGVMLYIRGITMIGLSILAQHLIMVLDQVLTEKDQRQVSLVNAICNTIKKFLFNAINSSIVLSIKQESTFTWEDIIRWDPKVG